MLHTDGESYHVVTDACVVVVMASGGIEEVENESSNREINELNQEESE